MGGALCRIASLGSRGTSLDYLVHCVELYSKPSRLVLILRPNASLFGHANN